MYDAQAIVEINNLMGRLVYEIAFGDIRAKLSHFFSDMSEIYLKTGVYKAVGYEEILKLLEQLEEEQLLSGHLHLLHSNAYKIADNKNEILGHWNTYSYFCQKEGKDTGSVSFGYLRFFVKFLKKDGQWKILGFECDRLITFEPETGFVWDRWDLVLGEKVMGKLNAGMVKMTLSPENYIHLRNLIGCFIQNGPGKASEYFSKENFSGFYIPSFYRERVNDVNCLFHIFSEVEEKERKEKLYHVNMTGTTPVIVQTDENHGQGWLLSQILSFSRADDGKTWVCLEVDVSQIDFIREKENLWKIAGWEMNVLFHHHPKEFHIPLHRPMAMYREEMWPQAPDPNVEITEATAEEIFRIESFLPQWTERLKRGDTEVFIDQYMYNHKEEISFNMASGRTQGYEKAREHQKSSGIKFNTGTMALRFPQFHTGNAPVAWVSSDEKYAEMTWMEWGWGNIGYGIVFSEEETHRTYTPMIGQYHYKFVKDGGQWKLYFFGWTPLIQGLPSWSYDTDKVRGWASRPYERPWPLPFESM